MLTYIVATSQKQSSGKKSYVSVSYNNSHMSDLLFLISL
jgi:hypothetical protein